MIKVGFFGTPEIARYCFERLADDFEIVFAITCEDKPQGRCLHVCATPVKEAAEKGGFPFFSRQILNLMKLSRRLNPTAQIFSSLSPTEKLFRVPYSSLRLGTINMHPSLLPKYRGAAPVQWALLNGESVSGITVQLIDERLDAGDVVLQKEFEIPLDADAESIYERILPDSYSLVRDAINLLNSGGAEPKKQDEVQATYCRKIDRDNSRISFEKSAMEVHNLVRGLNPKPGAWCSFRGKNIKLWKTEISAEQAWPDLRPGSVFKIGKKTLFVKTIDGALGILLLQPENKKIMTAVEFINGMRLTDEDRFE